MRGVNVVPQPIAVDPTRGKPRMLDQVVERRRPSCAHRYSVSLARTLGEIRDAQRLRYSVFSGEMGARLIGPEPGVDEDHFDAYCKHLIVRDAHTGDAVGTYRILSPSAARAAGGYYSDQEFDLARLAHLAPRMVEVGRSCIHPEYRTGSVISLLWSALAQYMVTNSFDYLIGCASISIADGGYAASTIYREVAARHLAPAELRVTPRCRMPLEDLRSDTRGVLPPLLKGYMRLGGYVCGEPTWDPDFHSADLFVLVPMTRLDPRYLRHFLGIAGSLNETT
jgi:putative hemolysin